VERFRLLDKDDIEVKVKKATENGVVLLLYKTSRTDMDCLDEAVGAAAWESDYKEVKGNLYAGIGIRDGSGRLIWKWDCGVESREDGEGNEKKGEASDAFKRAGFKWGIGRELYTAPFIFVNGDRVNLSQKNGKYSTYDRFSVEKIVYDDRRRISGLAIWNDTMKKRAFVWPRSGN